MDQDRTPYVIISNKRSRDADQRHPTNSKLPMVRRPNSPVSHRLKTAISLQSRAAIVPDLVWLKGLSLMTAAALVLDGRTSHRAVRAEDAAVAGLWLKQCLTTRALVKVLARISLHDFFTLLPATRACEHGF